MAVTPVPAARSRRALASQFPRVPSITPIARGTSAYCALRRGPSRRRHAGTPVDTSPGDRRTFLLDMDISYTRCPPNGGMLSARSNNTEGPRPPRELTTGSSAIEPRLRPADTQILIHRERPRRGPSQLTIVPSFVLKRMVRLYIVISDKSFELLEAKPHAAADPDGRQLSTPHQLVHRGAAHAEQIHRLRDADQQRTRLSAVGRGSWAHAVRGSHSHDSERVTSRVATRLGCRLVSARGWVLAVLARWWGGGRGRRGGLRL